MFSQFNFLKRKQNKAEWNESMVRGLKWGGSKLREAKRKKLKEGILKLT